MVIKDFRLSEKTVQCIQLIACVSIILGLVFVNNIITSFRSLFGYHLQAKDFITLLWQELTVPYLHTFVIMLLVLAVIKWSIKSISVKKSLLLSTALLLALVIPSFFRQIMVWKYLREIVSNYTILLYYRGTGGFPDGGPDTSIIININKAKIRFVQADINNKIEKNKPKISKYYVWAGGYKPNGFDISFSASKRNKNGTFVPSGTNIDFDNIVAEEEAYYIFLR